MIIYHNIIMALQSSHYKLIIFSKIMLPFLMYRIYIAEKCYSVFATTSFIFEFASTERKREIYIFSYTSKTTELINENYNK